jgi:hypothetical protein
MREAATPAFNNNKEQKIKDFKEERNKATRCAISPTGPHPTTTACCLGCWRAMTPNNNERR